MTAINPTRREIITIASLKPVIALSTRCRFPDIWPVFIVAMVSAISIVACMDPAGSYPKMPEGPGLTVDEIFNVEQGVYLVEQSRALGWLNLIPGTSQEAYRVENHYNPDHPPLGRLWLGFHHQLTMWLAPPFQPDGPIVTACARTGSATAFALTVLVVGWCATRWSGRAAGVLTAIALVLMPRVYGHAHLASLETITNLTCTCAVLYVANCWSRSTVPSKRTAIIAGILLGLALLTKIQAVLIPVPVICWSLWRWRTRALVPLAIWGITALTVFFAGWPYLWFAPVDHLFEYLGRTTNRSTISVWYFGQKFADKNVPWHYPFVMFAFTVPVLLHGFGLLGLMSNFLRKNGRNPSQPTTATSNDLATTMNRDPQNGIRTEESINRDVILFLCVLFPLVVFSIPGVAVYDSERLFLTSFPLWAIFVGRGLSIVWKFAVRWLKSPACSVVIVASLLLFVASPLMTMAPCHLCYDNGLATLLIDKHGDNGLETDYWGVGITRQLLERLVQAVPEGATVAIVPTLHQFQANEYVRQSPILRQHRVKMVEYHDKSSFPPFLMAFRRQADLPQATDHFHAYLPFATTQRAGRELAYIARIKE